MSARKVRYCYVRVPNRPGQGAEVLGKLKAARINLIACSGFPSGGGKAQIDLVADTLGPIRQLARKNGWKVSGTRKGFLLRGRDRVGAAYDQIRKLASQKINITAADAVGAGGGRYGMLLWVKEKDYARASRALKAK